MVTPQTMNPPEHIRIAIDPDFPIIVAERTCIFQQIFQTLRPSDEIESTGIGPGAGEKIVELHSGKFGLNQPLRKAAHSFSRCRRTINSDKRESSMNVEFM